MKKLFTKKPLWAVVFAAAAIFAVTFVACDTSSTSDSGDSDNTYVSGAVENDLIKWHLAGSSSNDDKYALYGANGTPIPGAGYWEVTITPAGNLAAGTSGYFKIGATTTTVTGVEANTIYYVKKLVGDAISGYYTASAVDTITIAGAAVGDVIRFSEASDIIKGASSKITVAGQNGGYVFVTGVKVDAVDADNTKDGYHTLTAETNGSTAGTDGKYYQVEAGLTNIIKAADSKITVAGVNAGIVKVEGIKVDAETLDNTKDGYHLTTAETNGTTAGTTNKFYLVDVVTPYIKKGATNVINTGVNGGYVLVTGVKVDDVDAVTTQNGYHATSADANGTVAATDDKYYRFDVVTPYIKKGADVTGVITATQAVGSVVKITGVDVDTTAKDTTKDGFQVVGTAGAVAGVAGKYFLVQGMVSGNWYKFQ